MEIACIYPLDLIAELICIRKEDESKATRMMAAALHEFVIACQNVAGPKVWARLYHQYSLAFWRDDTIGSPPELDGEPCTQVQVNV